MKETYTIIKSHHGKLVREELTGFPYKVYQSGDKWVWYKMPSSDKAVYTIHRKTGGEFIVYPRKENGHILVTEKLTGRNICPISPEWYHKRGLSKPKTFEQALNLACTLGDEIINSIPTFVQRNNELLKEGAEMKIAVKNIETRHIVTFENKEDFYNWYLSVKGCTDRVLPFRASVSSIIDDLPHAEYERVEYPKESR